MQRFMRVIAWLGLLLPALVLPLPVHAHPHVWTDYWVDAVSSKDGIVKLRFLWRFDTMFSTMVREDLKIKDLSPESIKKLQHKAFDNLKNFHYYTYIKYDGQELQPKDVQDFTARMHGEQLEYVFTVALPKAAQQVEVSLYDEELYVDIGPPMKDMGTTGSMMAAAQLVPEQFVKTSALPGAKPPVCTQREGETRTNPMWGKYKTFIASCTAQKD